MRKVRCIEPPKPKRQQMIKIQATTREELDEERKAFERNGFRPTGSPKKTKYFCKLRSQDVEEWYQHMIRDQD